MERQRIIYLKYQRPVSVLWRIFRTREKAVVAFTRAKEAVTAGGFRDTIEGHLVDSPDVPDCWVFILALKTSVPSDAIDVIMEGIRSDRRLERDIAKELFLMITDYLQSLEDATTRENIKKVSVGKTKTNSG